MSECKTGHLNWLDLEMKTNETEDKTLEVLHQVIEHSEAFWVPDR